MSEVGPQQKCLGPVGGWVPPGLGMASRGNRPAPHSTAQELPLQSSLQSELWHTPGSVTSVLLQLHIGADSGRASRIDRSIDVPMFGFAAEHIQLSPKPPKTGPQGPKYALFISPKGPVPFLGQTSVTIFGPNNGHPPPPRFEGWKTPKVVALRKSARGIAIRVELRIYGVTPLPKTATYGSKRAQTGIGGFAKGYGGALCSVPCAPD